MTNETARRAQESLAELKQALRGQLRRLRNRFVLHGTGWCVAALVLVVTLAFALDYTLRLPAPLRLALTILGLVFVAAGVRRRILAPLRIPLGERDVALLVESRFPELEQSLISAWEFSDPIASEGALRGASPDLVEQVIAQARERVSTLPLAEIVNPKRTVRVWTVAGIAIVIAAAVILPRTEAFRLFALRALGIDAEYPRRTHLFLELPTDQPDLRIERIGDEAIVSLAATGDLPVLVRAEGEQPPEVILVVEGGRGLPASIAMTRRPNERFRHVFRRVQGEFAFFARGGDDDRSDIRVRVRAIEPPLVAAVRATLTYPDYTGLPPAEQNSGAIEALIGTAVDLRIECTQPVLKAELKLLGANSTHALSPVSLIDDSGASRSFSGSFSVTATDQYEIHLTGVDRIASPRPATYPILALVDRPPVGRVIAPGSDDVNVMLVDARVPLRLEAEDDFGVRSVELRIVAGEESDTLTRVLHDAPTNPRPTAVQVVELVEAASLARDGRTVQVGDVIAFEFGLVDNKEPEAGRTELPRRTTYVVDSVELMRRLSTHFRRVREDVESALTIQRDRKDSLDGYLEAPPTTAVDGRDVQIVTLEVGQGRVLSTAKRAREGLSRAYDMHLFNGLEDPASPHVVAAMAFWAQFHRDRPTREPHDPEFYRALAKEQREGRIGRMDKALDPLLAMVQSADRVAGELGPAIVQSLEKASIAPNSAARVNVLRDVATKQTAAIEELESLLARLDQWNEFQDVIQSARALRDAQRELEYRTRAMREGTEKR